MSNKKTDGAKNVFDDRKITRSKVAKNVSAPKEKTGGAEVGSLSKTQKVIISTAVGGVLTIGIVCMIVANSNDGISQVRKENSMSDSDSSSNTDSESDGNEGGCKKKISLDGTLFSRASNLSEGLAWVEQKTVNQSSHSESYTTSVIDKDGCAILTLNEKLSEFSDFKDGLSFYIVNGSDFKIIDKTGKVTFSNNGTYNSIYAYGDGKFVVDRHVSNIDVDEWQVGTIDKNGNVVNGLKARGTTYTQGGSHTWPSCYLGDGFFFVYMVNRLVGYQSGLYLNTKDNSSGAGDSDGVCGNQFINGRIVAKKYIIYNRFEGEEIKGARMAYNSYTHADGRKIYIEIEGNEGSNETGYVLAGKYRYETGKQGTQERAYFTGVDGQIANVEVSGRWGKTDVVLLTPTTAPASLSDKWNGGTPYYGDLAVAGLYGADSKEYVTIINKSFEQQFSPIQVASSGGVPTRIYDGKFVVKASNTSYRVLDAKTGATLKTINAPTGENMFNTAVAFGTVAANKAVIADGYLRAEFESGSSDKAVMFYKL